MKKISILCVALAILAIACSKGSDTEPEKVTPVDTTTINTGVFMLYNIAADTAANSSNAAKAFYYSLEDQKVIPASQAQTSNWDLAFTGTYNSSIYANNGKAQYSPGYGGPGKGGIYMEMNSGIDGTYYNGEGKPFTMIPSRNLFDSAFSLVKTVNEGLFKTNESIGLDHFSGSGDGWAFYDFYGQQFPDQPYDSVTHVCYNMPRTLVVRTAKGNYAKVIIYSIYKDAPVIPTRSYKPGFITFKYAIQKDGTKNLDIK
ncbi:hypothetical protein GO495_00215 [Chitinophaga oryziterrae]|uniref:Heme-binding HmuY-like protein n=1 Tax=Chitinophaga oryziterrae TaxID=1031224 RepID=A0A6N8J1E5_9BACT|nr:HmuY family protein [Chitinophaga oryziterrae]MVT38990.1 hypothetical protein [Chitinophaga oryziterrae]